MSVEDPRVSAMSEENAAELFHSEIAEEVSLSDTDRRQEGSRVEMAQADIGRAPTGDRVPVATDAPTGQPAARVTEITADAANIVHLAAGLSIDEIRIEGTNLILVQADGTEVVIVNGATRVPTILLGEVEVPQQAFFAALEGSGINVAAGPDGSYSASSNPGSSGGDFQDTIEGSQNGPIALAALLGDTSFDDAAAGDGSETGEDQPTTFGTTFQLGGAEAATASGTFENVIIQGRLNFNPGTQFGTVVSVALQDIASALPYELRSGGILVTTSFVTSGTVGEPVLTLTGVANGVTVFTLVVTDVTTGAFTFTLMQALDHSGTGNIGVADVLNLPFTYTVQDKAGPPVTGSFTIDIADDGPTAIAGNASVVHDEALPGGALDSETSTKSVSGISLNIDWGADSANAGGTNDRTVVFTNANVSVFNAYGEVLTSLGETVTTVLVNGTLIGYTGTAVPESLTDGNVVFHATLSDVANGSYSFTLVKPLDHAEGDNENTLTLTFGYTAKDADGDTASSTFTVTVKDDMPQAYVTTSATTLDDEAQTLATGNAGGTGDVANAKEATGVAGSLFTAGADGVKSVTITNGAFSVVFKDGNGFAQTEAVTWGAGVPGENGVTTFTATSLHYTSAATLVIKADGSYTFTLNAPVAHTATANASGTEENQAIKFGFTVTDGDGDTATGSLAINVNDDAPTRTAVVNAPRVLDDEAQSLSPGNPGPGGFLGTDVSPDYKSVTGNAGALFRAGADGIRSVSVTTPAFSVIYKDGNGFALTEAVSWSGGVQSADGVTTFTATSAHYAPPTAGSLPAATLVIKADGSYTFTLNAPVVHAVNFPGVEENKTLSFGFTVTDGDGDTASGQLNIEVDDDTPVPIVSVVFGTVTLDDEAQSLFAGNPGPSGFFGGDAASDYKLVTGNAGALFKIGADGLGSIAITTPGFAVVYQDGGFAKTESVTWSIGVKSADGTTTWTATSEHYGVTNPAAVLVIRADGSYSFSLGAPVAHSLALPGYDEDKALTFNYVVRDGDGDQAGGALTILVNDDTPEAYVTTSVKTLDDEAQTLAAGNAGGTGDVTDAKIATGLAGSLFKAGADGVRSVEISNGAFSVIYKDGNGFALTEAVTWGAGQKGTDGTTTFTATSAHYTSAATLVIKADGSYTLTLNAPVAHGTTTNSTAAVAGTEEDRTITFAIKVTDGDGDTANGSLLVKVNDDAPVSKGDIVSATKLDDEAQTLATGNAGGTGDVANAKEATGLAGSLFTAGADGVKSVTITNGAFSVVFKDSNGFAQTEAVTWGTGVPGLDGTTTFTATSLHYTSAATLVIKADGSYTFTLNAPVAHETATTGSTGTEENQRIDIGFTVTDGDGDTATGSLKIDVNDDTPTIRDTHGLRYNTVSESDIGSGATASWNYTDGSNPSIKYGADGFGSATFTGAIKLDVSLGSGAGNVSLNLASGVKSTSKLTSDGKIVTFELVDAHTIQGYVLNGNVKTPVIELKLVGSTVTTTLFAPLDHSHTGTLEASQKIEIDAVIVFKDGDGDSVTSTIRTTIVDSVPSVGPNAAVSLDDDALAGGNPDGVGDVSPDTANLTGVLAHNFGTDGAGSIAWLTTGSPTGFSYETSGTTLLIKQAGTLVMTVTLDASGAYAVTQNAPVKHANGANENTQGFTLTYGVTDGDGDIVTGSLNIDVNDDTPTIRGTHGLRYNTVSESDIGSGATASWNYTDGSNPSIKYGADGFGSATFTGAIKLDVSLGSGAGNVSLDLSGGVKSTSKLTSDGKIVTFELVDAHTIQGYILNGTVKTPVIELKLVGSTVTTTLFAPLDHSHTGTLEASQKIEIDAVIVFKDGDGDSVTSTIRTTIMDSVPTIAGTVENVNLLANGDFAGGAWGHSESWGQWTTESIGWKIDGTVPGQQDVRLERIADGYLGMQATGDSPMVDLGATPGNVAISQNISGLVIGESYSLRFEAGSPDMASAKLEVYWNGQLAGTVQPTGSMTWTTLPLIAAAGVNVLTFKEVGAASDNTGTFLANVSLTHGVAVPVFEKTTGEDSGVVSFKLTEGVDYSFGADKNGTISFDSGHVTIATPNGTTIILPPAAYSFNQETGTFTITPGWAFNGLSKGEVATLTIPFTVTDGDGDKTSAVYQVTITGDNDVIQSSIGFPEQGTVTEYAAINPNAGSTTDRTSFDDGYNGGGFHIRDDQGDHHTITIQPQNTNYLGYLTAAVSEETVNDGDGFVLWNYHVSDAALNPLAEGEEKIEKFTITVSDGHGTSTSREITVTLKGTNDAPLITLEGGDSVAATLAETNAGLATSGTVTVKDADLTDIVTASVHSLTVDGPMGSLTAAALKSYLTFADAQVLDATETSDKLTWNFNSGTQAFDFLAQGETLKLTYVIRATDDSSGAAFDDQTVTITITGTNDVPVIDLDTTSAGNGVAISAVEQLPYQFAYNADISDVDTDTLASMKLTLGNVQDGASESLSLNPTGLAAATGLNVLYSGGVLTITGTASVAVYETILKNVVYSNASDNPHVGVGTDRTVSVVVNDGFADSATQVATIKALASNDPPALAGTLKANVDEGSAHTLTFAELGYTDPDNSDGGVVFKISNLANGIITNGGASATSFTAAELKSGLIQFVHNGSETATASFSVAVEDGNQDNSPPVSQQFNLSVKAVNDGKASITLSDSTPLTGPTVGDTLQANLGTDPDNGNGSSVTYKWYRGTAEISGATNSSYKLTSADIGAKISAQAIYVDGQGFHEQATSDLTIAVVSGNQAPSAASKTVQLVEDVTYTFKVADFGFSDPDSGDTFAGATVGGVNSAAGKLMLGNAAITGSTYVTSAQIASGMLTWAPTNDVRGQNGDASFTFSVRDSQNAQSSAKTMTMDMSNVNYEDLNSPSSYVFGSGAGYSNLSVVGTSNTDRIDYEPDNNPIRSLEIMRSNNNLEINLDGRTITALNHFSSNRVELVSFDGATYAGHSLGGGDYNILQGISGSNGNDVIAGSAAADSIDGGDGKDLLFGNGGNDTIFGRDGNDLIVGGAGNDTLSGGAGSDTFAWGSEKLAAENVDRITDYSTSDRIDVSLLVPSNAGQSGYIRIVKDGNDLLVKVDQNGGGNSYETAYRLVGSGNLQSVNVYYAGTNHEINKPSAGWIVAADPIILDLDHNGFALTSLDNGVSFDINADGHQDKVAWTSADGILAYDVDGNGKIDNGSEIFTPDFNGGHHASGLAALATLDSNGDGKIDAGDEAFSKLSIWVDANNNGISDDGELSGLFDHSITSISLEATVTDGLLEDGQAVLSQGHFTLGDGSMGDFLEVGFDSQPGGLPDNILIGGDGDDILVGGPGFNQFTGGAGADTFVLDPAALQSLDMADVVTDYKSGEGDVLDVSKLLDTMLGHAASETEAAASVKTTITGNDTTVSVQVATDTWKDVAVLQNHTEAVKILFDEKHTVDVSHH